MIEGKITVVIKPDELFRRIQQAQTEPLNKCAILVETVAKTNFGTTSKSKKKKPGTYYNSMRGYWVTPSPEGKPPNIQTANLRNSIHWEKDGANKRIVGPTTLASYGRVHEFGGRHHKKRPFMLPALNKARPYFLKFFKGAVR